MPRIDIRHPVPSDHARVREKPLRILVEPVPFPLTRRGIYGDKEDRLPERMLWLHPDALRSIQELERDYPGVFRYSDMFRGVAGQIRVREKNRERRRASGRPVRYAGKLPGYSAHGYGLAIDHDVRGNLKRLARFLLTREDADPYGKREYDLLMRKYGWYCHRDAPHGDHKRKHEEWHFNFFGDDPKRWLAHCEERTDAGIEAKIRYMYGPLTCTTPKDFDVRSFQEAHTLRPDGIFGPMSRRVKAYVDARFVTEAGDNVTERLTGKNAKAAH